MKSDLKAARFHLERAFYYLCGDDAFSGQMRKSVDTLMDEIAFSDSRDHAFEDVGDRRREASRAGH